MKTEADIIVEEEAGTKGCLVMTRKPGERFFIDDTEVVVMQVGPGNRVRLAVRAPHDVLIRREDPARRD